MINILAIDDDPAIQTMIAHIMARSGYAINTVGTLANGLELLQKQHFDLVISDLCLPDGSGLQILTEVKKNYPQIYVIILTGYPDIKTIQIALRQGAFDYLIKPIPPVALVHAITHAIEFKRSQEEREMLTNRLEAVFRSVDDAIIAMDKEWRIFQFNDACARLFGFDPTVIGLSLQNALPWMFPSVEPLLKVAREEGLGKRTVHMVTMNEDEVERNLNCTASLYNDLSHNAQGVILVVRDESRLTLLERETKTRQGWHGLVGYSSSMQEVYQIIEQLAEVDSTVLITGETGTGKELAARALHDSSPRGHRGFVAVNCAALPIGLIESELFGHVRGAFTNAIRDKPGKFKLADGGTIFLDEIGDLSMEMQVKLLRVLQEKTFEALGDSRPIRVNVRVVTATHRDLRERVREGLFREDLYYRLKVVEMHMPPLREHKADLPLLIDHFLVKLNARLKRSVKGVDAKVLAAIMDYDWPGNVRELEHLLEHAMVMAPQSILMWNNLPSEFRTRTAQSLQEETFSFPVGNGGRPLQGGQSGLKRESVLQALTESRWKVQLAAVKLGISRSTLWRRMRAMGLYDPNLIK